MKLLVQTILLSLFGSTFWGRIAGLSNVDLDSTKLHAGPVAFFVPKHELKILMYS